MNIGARNNVDDWVYNQLKKKSYSFYPLKRVILFYLMLEFDFGNLR